MMPEELFTQESLLTLVGLTGMVYVASNSLQRAFNFNPKWLALAIAQVLCILGVYLAFADFNIINYIIGVFNGFLVYLTASGATSAGDSTTRQAMELPNQTRKFSSRWW